MLCLNKNYRNEIEIIKRKKFYLKIKKYKYKY